MNKWKHIAPDYQFVGTELPVEVQVWLRKWGRTKNLKSAYVIEVCYLNGDTECLEFHHKNKPYPRTIWTLTSAKRNAERWIYEHYT